MKKEANMELELQRVKVEDKSVLRNLLELYLHDFSEFEESDVDEHGLYCYNYLDNYWTEPGRTAFFLRCAGKLAGFAMLRDIPEGDTTVHFMAEFFVMRKYRRLHIGQNAAGLVFDRFPGCWRVAQETANYPAQRFWRRVIEDYTGGDYKEVKIPDWDGPVQEFTVLPQPVGSAAAQGAVAADPGPGAAVSLREITKDRVRAVIRMSDTLQGAQKYMVAPNSVSLAQVHYYQKGYSRAIYADETPVGFIMWHAGAEPDFDFPGYFLWRFMIARPYQGSGYGKKALLLLIEQSKAQGAAELYVSCGVGPGSPEGFYRKLGFKPTGKKYDDEIELKLVYQE
jgi:predicted acetyltransferase/ribosomal protein S18 acetylase RimI-like enzyme